MHILTPQQVSVKKTVAEDIARKTALELECKLRERRTELNNFEDEIKKIKSHQQSVIEENNRTILQLNDEISRLQAERRENMIPVDNLKQLLENEIAQFKSKRAECAYRETEARNIRDQYNVKIEDLIEKKENLEDREEKLNKREAGIFLQESSLKKITEELYKKINQHNEEIEKKTKELTYAENKLKQEVYANNVIRKTLENEKEELATREAELQARYATLEKTEKRLKHDTSS